MSSSFLKPSLLSSIAMIAAIPMSAQAQERKLDTVVITTTPGPERNADELIGNASRIERAELLENLDSSLGNTLSKEPGISSSYFGPAASRPIVRGLGAERVLVLTNGIGVIDASAASPDHQVTADGIDAKRIEILRGPAALAYGGQAIGGVVNVIDGLIVEEKPEKAANGEIFSAYNSVSEGTELAGVGDFTVGNFVFSGSASLKDFNPIEIPGFAESSLFREQEEAEEEHDHQEEDVDHEDEHEAEEEVYGTLPNSFAQQQTYGLGVSWVGDSAFLGAAMRYQGSQYGLIGHTHEHEHEEEGEEEEHDHEEEGSPYIDLEQFRYDLRGGVSFDDSLIRQIIATASVSDYEHTEFEPTGEAGTVFNSDGFETRVELDHAPIAGFEGAIGFDFSDKDFEAIGEESFISPTSTQRTGVFVYEARDFANDAGLEAGLRYENTIIDNYVAGSRDFDALSASLGLHKHITDTLFVGAQYAYTERAPTDIELFADGPHLATNQYEEGNADLELEKGSNLEFTARWSNDTFSIGANLFYNTFDSFIYLAPEDEGHEEHEDHEEGEEEDHDHGELPHFVFSQNDADFFGGEIYMNAMLGEFGGANWTLDTSVDLVEAEFDDGAYVPYVPPLSARINLDADWKVWTAGAEIVYAADQNDAGAGSLPTDGYTLFNAKAGLNLDQLGVPAQKARLFVEVRNITDEEARLATSVLKDVAPLPGRNVRVGLSYAF